MSDESKKIETDPRTLDERRVLLEEQRLLLERSFAKKWFPTLATLTIAFVAGVFGFVQQQISTGATDRATIESRTRSELEWGFKVIELYLTKRDELFDIAKNPERASRNLQALAAVAPTTVQGVLNAELSRIPPPANAENDASRLDALVSAAKVQSAIAATKGGEAASTVLQPADFTIYLQYPEGARDVAEKVQTWLIQRGYRVHGIEQVRKVPSRLEVRYYRPEQRPLAESLAKKLGEVTGQTTDKVNAKMLTTTKTLPTGIMEVWLSK